MNMSRWNGLLPVAALGIVFASGLGIFLWQYPTRVYSDAEQFYSDTAERTPADELALVREREALIHQYRSTVVNSFISSVGTIAAIAGGVAVFLNYRNARDTLDVTTKRLDLESEKFEQEAKLSTARLTSERFAKAVEQLGNEESIHIRLGGIYSLGRLAEDSNEMSKTVLDVLIAFIRDKCQISASEECETTQDEEVSADSQAALTVTLAIRGENEIDLSNTALCKVNLHSANLSKVNLRSANLSAANLNCANLNESILYKANLQGSKLIEAKLSKTNLSCAILTYATLSGANLSSSSLSSTKVQCAMAVDANLEEADLNFADFSGASLEAANLNKAKLWLTTLAGTNLRDAHLQDASLLGANLSGANLNHADLSSSDLSGAVLLATDFRSSRNLTRDQLETENPPLLCNVALPSNLLDAGIDPNRDCNCIAERLHRSRGVPLQEAKQLVAEARKKQWED